MPDVAVIEIAGERLCAHPMGALYAPAHETLLVADLHFEKGSSFARRGLFLPPYDTRTTLLRLAALCRRFDPRRIVSLGDAFHDAEAEARLADDDATLLEALIAGRRWIWILGNHDPRPPRRFTGEIAREHRLGPLVLRHEPERGPAPGEIAGHLHPCALIRTEGRTQRRRCFAADGTRLIMPAFGAYAGGLNLLDEAFLPYFREPTAWALGARGVYPIDKGRLAPEARRSSDVAFDAGGRRA